jgi:NNP family nitrate/nitrite transporter-like MFS transporter
VYFVCWHVRFVYRFFRRVSVAGAKTQFPEVNVMQLAFLGPLIGAMTRAGSGWIADRYGGGRVTIWVFIIMMIGALGVLHFLENKELSYAFHGFFAMFLLLFAATGCGKCIDLPDDPDDFP